MILISARWPDLVVVNKKDNLDLAVPANHRVKQNESEKRDKYQDLARELKNYSTRKWQWYQL